MHEREVDNIYALKKGSNNSTFRADPFLPSLPLPTLEETLNKYLESVKPFVSSSEFINTQQQLEKFKNGQGKILHKKLEEKVAKSKNWLEAWWEEWGYHRVRTPLLPFCSMDGQYSNDLGGWTTNGEEDQIYNGAMVTYLHLKFWLLVRDSLLQPVQSADKKTTFSMSQYKRLFNTVRVPGPECDKLISYFKTTLEGSCPSHVVVLCRGRIYCVNALDSDGQLITPPEWAAILRRIRAECFNQPAEHKVPVLTCDNRTTWSKNRQRLLEISQNNVNAIKEIETAITHLVLDDASPTTDTILSNFNLRGSTGDRWADKSLTSIIYRNGRIGGISEHSAYDGIISISMMHYCYLSLQECRGGWQGRLDLHPEVTNPQEIKFDLNEELKKEIRRVTLESTKNSEDLIMTRSHFNDFGKIEIQKCKIHPDAFVQMALQLTYNKIHHSPAPCYETATTRSFYNGRTETVRSCSTECLDWVYAMLDQNTSRNKKHQLLKRAITRHERLMNEAKNGGGCDRHLFGLYCTALEEGLPIPEIYNDPAYTKSGGGGNFVLSTSLTGYAPIGGGVAPMVLEGYGVFYSITPKSVSITVSTFRNSKETDADLFFLTLCESFREMRDVILLPETSAAKL